MRLTRSTTDWLLAIALAGMLLRATLLVWSAPLITTTDFMLLCTSQGIQLVAVDGQEPPAHSPCAQCSTQASSLPVLVYLPPAPARMATPVLLEAQVLRWYPPFLLAPPNRAPPLYA